MIRRPQLFFWLLLLPPLLWGRVSMDVQPRTFSLDNTTTLTLTVQSGITGTPQFDLPEGLEVVATSRNDLIRGTARETTFRYTLRATAPGDFIIGPYTLQLEGRTHAVEGIPITVSPAEVITATEDLFLRMELSASRTLVQQPLTLTITFYSINQIDDIQLVEMKADGLQVGDWQSLPGREQLVNGRRYLVRRFQTQITPQIAGIFDLQPLFLLQVLEPDEGLTRDRFGMFTRMMTRRSVRLQGEPVHFEARYPPAEGRPHDFDGALGRFTLAASVSPRQLRVGEPITLRVELNGRGNLRNLMPPSISESDDFRIFSPRIVEEDLARDGQSGRRVLEQVLIPRHAEIETFPEIRFSFFDPERWEYVTRSEGPFPLEILPAAQPAAGGIGGTQFLNLGTHLLGQDLVYLKTSPGRRVVFGPSSPLRFTLWTSLPLSLWALGAGLLLRQRRLEADPALARQLQAPRRVRQQLDAVRQSSPETRYEAIWHCLATCLSHRFRIPPGEVEADVLPRHLVGRIPDTQLQEICTWLQRCERARFTGGGRCEDAEIQPFLTLMQQLISGGRA